MPDDQCRIVVSAVLRRAAGFSQLPAARRGHGTQGVIAARGVRRPARPAGL